MRAAAIVGVFTDAGDRSLPRPPALFHMCAAMTIHLYQPLQPLAADGGAMMRVLNAAGIDKSDLIRVVGPSAALAAIWLSRHGYERAVVARAAPSGAARPADAILIGQPCSADELGELMAIAGEVHDDGAVLVQTRQGRGGEEAEALANVLGQLGFRAQRRLNDKGRPIFIARRIGLPTLRKAA
jgi:hypothetical protein